MPGDKLAWLLEHSGALTNSHAFREIRATFNHFPKRELLYAGRAPAAAPATGIAKIHDMEQAALIDAALRSSAREESARETTRLSPNAPATGGLRKSS